MNLIFIKSPGVLAEQRADEVFGLIRNIFKALLIKLPLGSCDQGQGLCITVTLEWRLTTQPDEQQQKKDSSFIIFTVSNYIH